MRGAGRLITLINGLGSAASLFYTVNGGPCTTLGTGSGRQTSLGCRDPAATTVLFDDNSDCDSPFTNTPPPGVTISTLGSDANNDSTITIVLPANNTVVVY